MCFRLPVVFDVPVIIGQIAVSVQWPYGRWNLEPSGESEVDDGSSYLFSKMRETSETDFCQTPLLVKLCVLLLKATRAIVWPITKEALSETSISFYRTV